ncbi:MAG: hypothetical protein KC415_23050 [Anaerolineales bacterium]|nr:hypothetical protein [Anaerolineales bacterium]
MIDFLAEHPGLTGLLYCLCAPGGFLPLAGVWWLARHYDVRNPFTARKGGGKSNDDL